MKIAPAYVQTVIEIAPFLGVIFLEIAGNGFKSKFDSIYLKNASESNLNLSDKEKGRIDSYSFMSFEYEEAMQHFDLMLIYVIIIFVSKISTFSNGTRKLILSIIFTLLTMKFMERKATDFFQNRSPHRYETKDVIMGYHYSRIIIIGLNILSISFVILINLELLNIVLALSIGSSIASIIYVIS